MGVLFQKEDQLNFFFLSLAIMLNSFLEILGISLIVPFISLLAHPAMLETNRYLHWVYQTFSFHSFLQFMIVLDIVIIAVFIIKNVVLFLLAFLQARFILNKQTYICARLFKAYLLSPYKFHLQRNLGQFQERLKAVELLMSTGVVAILTILTEGLLVTCLFFMLIKTNPWLTVGAMAVLTGGLVAYFYFLKDRIQSWGVVSRHHFALLWQQVNQGLGSIKESKLLGKEFFFINSYRHHMHQVGVQQTKSELVARSPRLFIETTVVVLVMASMAVCLLSGQAPSSIFATISVFALVTLRLMPSLNRISSSWGNLKFFMPSFDAIYDDLINCEKMEGQQRERTSGGPLSFREDIKLKDISFYYEKAKTAALDHVSLTIPKNSVVGFIGPSGAGKTTIVDIILGLLDPSSGTMLVDGVNIHSHVRSWQTTIGYIPQIIYLCDDTIRNNIAFGLEPQEIDDEKIERALRLAQLDKFIQTLPDGIQTKVGERGIRLSGGQRQRIGIARALYHDPQVLVMDEATAALDNETERLFMDALFHLSKERTIIIIAHRLSTVQQCDKIFFLKEGRLISEGKYNELSEVCPDFRKMAGVGHF